MKKSTTEFPAPDEERLQSSLKRVRTDSTEIIDKNCDGHCLDPSEILFGHSCNFFQTPKPDDSGDMEPLDVNMFDPDLFPELDFLESDLTGEIPTVRTHGFSDQTTSVNPSSHTWELNSDDLCTNLDLELDSNFFEIDETTFKL